MKKLGTTIIVLAIAMTLILTAAGCAAVPGLEPSPSPSPTAKPSPSPTKTPVTGVTTGTGTLQVLVTDAPPKDEVTSILITVSELQIHQAVAVQQQKQEQEQEQEQEGGGKWITIDIIDGKNTFDLLKIKGIEELLGESKVDAGKYTQVRLVVEKAEVGLNGEQPNPATVPSGVLKLVHPFEIVEGETTAILLDFDAEKSVNVTGKDKIMVKPVVKLSVKQGKAESKTEKPSGVTEEASLEIAEDLVKNEATFVFDGIGETLKMGESEQVRNGEWQFTFEFDSRHAGYGDRTGQMLAEVITHHTAVVTVKNGNVTRALMDGKGDMLKQQEITTANPASSLQERSVYV